MPQGPVDARESCGGIAPEFAEITDEGLFGDVGETGRSIPRERQNPGHHPETHDGPHLKRCLKLPLISV